MLTIQVGANEYAEFWTGVDAIAGRLDRIHVSLTLAGDGREPDIGTLSLLAALDSAEAELQQIGELMSQWPAWASIAAQPTRSQVNDLAVCVAGFRRKLAGALNELRAAEEADDLWKNGNPNNEA